MRPKAIGIIGFDGIVGIDLTGPAEAFAAAEIPSGNSKSWVRCYEVITIGISKRPFVSESGVTFVPTTNMQTAPPVDTLIVPGGRGVREPLIGKQIGAFLRERARTTRRIASICTGLYGLAR